MPKAPSEGQDISGQSDNCGRFTRAQDAFFSFRKYHCFKSSVIKDVLSQARATVSIVLETLLLEQQTLKLGRPIPVLRRVKPAPFIYHEDTWRLENFTLTWATDGKDSLQVLT